MGRDKNTILILLLLYGYWNFSKSFLSSVDQEGMCLLRMSSHILLEIRGTGIIEVQFPIEYDENTSRLFSPKEVSIRYQILKRLGYGIKKGTTTKIADHRIYTHLRSGCNILKKQIRQKFGGGYYRIVSPYSKTTRRHDGIESSS